MPLNSIIPTQSVEWGHSDHGYVHQVLEALQINTSSLIHADSQVKYAMLARGDANLYIRKPPRGYKDKIWVNLNLLLNHSGSCSWSVDFGGSWWTSVVLG